MACDPALLLEQAKCITTCIPPGMMPSVNTALLCQIVDAGGGGGGGGIVNVSEQVVGAGTAYTLTATMANVVFGTTSPTTTLPTAGTYLVIGSTTYQADAIGAADAVQMRLRNTTDGVTIGGAGSAFNAGLASNVQEAMVFGIVTITAAKTVTIQAVNLVAARGTLLATSTVLGWVRLA